VSVDLHGADDAVSLPEALGASVVAGFAMLLTWAIASALSGRGFWTPLQLAAAALSGPGALLADGGSAATGIALQLGFSIAWGVLYASMLWSVRQRWRGGLLLGLAYGGALFFVMVEVIAPWGDPTLLTQAPPLQLLLANLVYGAVLGLWMPVRRATAPRPHLVTASRSSPRE
jgi:hypothetical protein